MKKGFKITCMLMAIALVLSLVAGCGNTASTSSTAPASAPATTTTPSTPAAPESTQIAPDWKGATFTLGTLNPEVNADSMAAQWFADQLAEKTDGRLKINVFANSQLGNQNAQIEALTMGTQDFFIGGMEPFASIAPELNILNVFFMFESQEQFQAFFSSSYYEAAKEKLAASNIVPINNACNWVKGPYRILMSTKPISGELSSIKGLTVRIPNQETFQKGWTALGATPIVVALNETYLAMQQGLVDGCDLIPASIASNGFQEVIKYILKTDAFPQREGVMMSKQAMDTLPAEIQELIYETADAAGEYYTSFAAEKGAEAMQMCKDKGIVVIEDADLREWYEACANLGYDLESSGYLPAGITDAVKALK